MSLKTRLAGKEFVVSAEINTPKGVNISEMINNARRIKERVHAVVIPDMDNGIMRMSALAGAALMQQQGLEAMVHIYGRDRNRMALQSDLLAAHVMGIQNVVVAHAEPIENGDCRDAQAVNDLDEIGLLGAVESLNAGADLSGFDLNGSPDLFAGCTFPACAPDQFDQALEAARQKVAAGARFVVLPAVYDINHFDTQLSSFRSLEVPLVATVFLIKSAGIARYIAQNEPGAVIDEALVKRIRKASDRDSECLKIAGETIAALKSRVDGIQIATHGWENRIPTLLDYAGI